jgi:protein arginine kinase activator
MKCQNCGERDATVHLTEITDDGKSERHLCEECARQQQVAAVEKTMSIAGFLHKLLHEKAAQEAPGAAKMVCPSCGISYLEFRSCSRLGCPNDYEAFSEALLPLIRRIQDGARHCGKAPSRVDPNVRRQNELIRLRRDLERAVQREDYETAAGIRDRIRSLDSETGSA